MYTTRRKDLQRKHKYSKKHIIFSKSLMLVFSSASKEKCKNPPYSFSPDCFVQSGVNADIGSAHLLHGKFPDFLEGAWCSLLEAPGTITRAISLTSGHCTRHLLHVLSQHKTPQSTVLNSKQLHQPDQTFTLAGRC